MTSTQEPSCSGWTARLDTIGSSGQVLRQNTGIQVRRSTARRGDRQGLAGTGWKNRPPSCIAVAHENLRCGPVVGTLLALRLECANQSPSSPMERLFLAEGWLHRSGSRCPGQGEIHSAGAGILIHLGTDCQGTVEAHNRGVKVQVVLTGKTLGSNLVICHLG